MFGVQARLEDHRRLLAAQESEQDERERLRMEIRALLESRIRFARSAESTLRALSIPMEYDPATRAPNINKAVRRALRFYHPDRYQVSSQFEVNILSVKWLVMYQLQHRTLSLPL